MKILMAAIFLASICCQTVLAAQTSTGRLVVFADKKEGALKADKSIRLGTSEKIDNLKMVEDQKGVHACFVGSPDAIKPILTGMIDNTNKSEQKELKLKTFEKAPNSSQIHFEVTSEAKRQVYLELKIGPC